MKYGAIVAAAMLGMASLAVQAQESQESEVLPKISAEEIVNALSSDDFNDRLRNTMGYLRGHGVGVSETKVEMTCSIENATFRHFGFILECNSKWNSEGIHLFVQATKFTSFSDEKDKQFFDWDSEEAIMFRRHIRENMGYRGETVTIIGIISAMGMHESEQNGRKSRHVNMTEIISIDGLRVPKAKEGEPEDRDAYYKTYEYY